METETIQQPMPVSLSEAPVLRDKLKAMTKEQLIQYADEAFALTVDARLKTETIIDKLLEIEKGVKAQADKLNKESVAMTEAEDDPVMDMIFHRMDFPEADLEFSFSGKRGMRGANNPKGFAKCPSYHFWPGETYSIPWSVKEHLESLTFSTHKPVIDPVSGLQSGAIPIIKPRFVLQLKMTKEQVIKMKH